MMMSKHGMVGILRAGFLTVLVTVVTAGCRPGGSSAKAVRDRQHPLMERAVAHEQSGDVDKAVDLYREIVLDAPRNAEAHFSLALLLHDVTQEYVEAIYHYRVYLRLRPDSDKSEIARDRIRKAERLFRVSLAERVPVEGLNGIDAHTATQLRVLQQKLSASEAARHALKEQADSADELVRTLELNTRDLSNRIARLERQLAAALSPPDALPDIGQEAFDNVRPRTYVVKQGDNLSRIAEKVYDDAALWTRIRDANRDKIDNQNRVREGQVLVIPYP